MGILLTTSESVVKGTGAITLACAVGANYTADISTATIVGTKVFFPSPGLLTDGQLYTISAPAGLLVDGVGNSLAASQSCLVLPVLQQMDIVETVSLQQLLGQPMRLPTRQHQLLLPCTLQRVQLMFPPATYLPHCFSVSQSSSILQASSA